jgi:hypothetical protein
MTTVLTSSYYFDQIDTQNTDSNELDQLIPTCELSILFGDEALSHFVAADLGDISMQLYQPMIDNQSSDPQVQAIDEVEQPMQPTRIFNDLPNTKAMPPKPHGRPRPIKPLIDLTIEPMEDENVIETKKRLGRKRIDASAPTTHASTSGLSSGKKTKKQKMLEEAAEKNETVVCFGNQVVAKETPEYAAKRKNNNEAVKKFREKKAQENLEREVKMPELQKENENLKANLDSLVKGINEIKNNILLLNRGRNLPEDISNLLRQFEEECKNS